MIMAEQDATTVREARSIWTWLFNPFRYIAGGPALSLGLAAIAAAGLVAYFGRARFDGVLDFHTQGEPPFGLAVADGLINWIVMVVLLWAGGRLVSSTRFRALDLLGTQALARWPMAIAALAVLLPGYQRFSLELMGHVADPEFLMEIVSVQAVLAIVVVLLMVIWMVALMYNGFAVSCNLSGGKALGIFVPAIIVGEVISNLLIYRLLPGFFASAGA